MVAFESNADILVPIQNINESQHYENHQHPSFLRCKFSSFGIRNNVKDEKNLTVDNYYGTSILVDTSLLKLDGYKSLQSQRKGRRKWVGEISSKTWRVWPSHSLRAFRLGPANFGLRAHAHFNLSVIILVVQNGITKCCLVVQGVPQFVSKSTLINPRPTKPEPYPLPQSRGLGRYKSPTKAQNDVS